VDLCSVPMIVPSEVACLEFGSTFAEPSALRPLPEPA
jgi:hypothetical protein